MEDGGWVKKKTVSVPRAIVKKTVSGPRAIVQKTDSGPRAIVQKTDVRTCISIPLHKQYPVGLGEMIPDARSNFLNGAPPPLGVYSSIRYISQNYYGMIV